MFNAWSAELAKLGPDAVEYGINAIDLAGSSYAPNLNKFVASCRKDDGSSAGGLLPGSETLHGGKSRPTPDGMPLSFMADGDYAVSDMYESPHPEDQAVAARMEQMGWTYQQYRQARCAELGIEYK